ncbi:HAD hydrolase family protein [Terrimonas sp. NA20]|uniref:HAD hydrolase family protein n=1 Tax=Terrimonas ginsenosidimutans TaxID=2908004 RepID=A0ABS9KRS0_9BACT|nr:HAD hydrolase family protein [Terrimonas ginsenosidimutans]MCG2615019.1 HAD hydrolase family protein [Terrimonas ginsenosidimutans]
MNINDQLKNITTFILDVDGVLTDGTILVLENGVQARRMSIRDGYALQLAIKKGYRVLVISGAAASPVLDRLNKLGIYDIHMGASDKLSIVRHYMVKHQLLRENLLFMGDDMPDLEVMQSVGIAACPADAVDEIKQISSYISPVKGGEGCVRDVMEKVMKLKGDWIHVQAVASR